MSGGIHGGTGHEKINESGPSNCIGFGASVGLLLSSNSLGVQEPGAGQGRGGGKGGGKAKIGAANPPIHIGGSGEHPVGYCGIQFGI